MNLVSLNKIQVINNWTSGHSADSLPSFSSWIILKFCCTTIPTTLVSYLWWQCPMEVRTIPFYVIFDFCDRLVCANIYSAIELPCQLIAAISALLDTGFHIIWDLELQSSSYNSCTIQSDVNMKVQQVTFSAYPRMATLNTREWDTRLQGSHVRSPR